MKDHEIILEYIGHPTFSTIGRILTMLKYKMIEKGIEPGIYKRILSVIIEALENVYKYSDNYNTEPHIYKNFSPHLKLEKNSQSYFITVKNPVKKKDAEGLKAKIENINNKKTDELKLFYRQTISNGKFSKKGGAGLGLIEMAKISGNKLGYKFDHINNDYKLYTLTIQFD